MTTPIEDRIKRVMSTEADLLSPPKGLAERVIARGRRVRTAWRLSVGVAIVSGIVAAAVIPAAIVQSARPDPAVIPDPAPTQLLSPTTAPYDPDARFDDLPKGGPLRLPYTLGRPADGGYLRDGDARVPVPAGMTMSVFGRVSNGWFVARIEAKEYADHKPRGEFGILRRSGEFKRLGALAHWIGTLSPDGGSAAFPCRESDGRVSLVVANVETGERTATIPIHPDAAVVGWNAYGIWFRAGETSVWQPGSEPRVVPQADWLQIELASTRMLRVQSDAGCADVVTLGPNGRLVPVRRFCLKGLDGATLSPDGHTIILPDGTAHPVDGGRSVKIRAPGSLVVTGLPWEDDSHVVMDDSEGDEGSFRSRAVRCDVRTGRCERSLDERAASDDGYFEVAPR